MSGTEGATAEGVTACAADAKLVFMAEMFNPDAHPKGSNAKAVTGDTGGKGPLVCARRISPLEATAASAGGS